VVFTFDARLLIQGFLEVGRWVSYLKVGLDTSNT